MTEQLHDDLAALAAQVRLAGLDLPALRQTARRRVRRRRLLVSGPALLAVVATALAVPALLRDPQDRLTTATAPPEQGLRLTLSAALEQPAVPGLSVRVEPGPVTSEQGTRFGLTWTLAADREPLQGVDFLGFTLVVAADHGPGVVGVTDGRCGYWDQHGDQVEHSCPASLPVVLEPGSSTTGHLLIAGTVATGSIADGTYRFALPQGPLGTVDLDLTVTGSQSTGARPVPVTGSVSFPYPRPAELGQAQDGVAASITLQSDPPGRSYQATTNADGSWASALLPGHYRVTVTPAAGNCPPQALDVLPGRPATVAVACSPG